MKKRILLAIVALLSVISFESNAREVIKFNKGWRWSKSLSESEPSKSVNLPHTWNSEPLSMMLDKARGGYFYTKKVEIPENWNNKMIFIRFKGVASVATLMVNGKYVGEHKGAFTAFTFDITPYIKAGANNSIVMYVDNSTRYDVFPLTSDNNLYGGIYRDVELIVTDKLHITPLHFSSDGVYVTQKSLTNTNAEVDVRVMLAGQYGDKGSIKTTIYKDDDVISTQYQDISIGLDGELDLNFPFSIENPKRWHGKEAPNLYCCSVEILDAEDNIIDNVDVNFGLRTISVDREKGFMLNETTYPLRGVTYMQDWAGVYSALRNDNRERDIALINELGATAIRCANNPHDKELYDLTDENGIVTWVDLPFTGDLGGNSVSFVNSAELKANGNIQLQEMIYQLYNHPSVAILGLFSNLAGHADFPIEYIESLNASAKGLNQNILTVGCSNEDGAVNNITDLISWAQYFGWNSRSASDINIWLDTFTKEWKKLMPAVGEYGAAGSVYQQSENSVNSGVGSKWYPESSQTDFHITYSNALLNRPYIWGSFINSMFDYGVSYSKDGDVNSINDLGLVTHDRLIKKDAFYLYKARWNKSDKFIHITGKRIDERNNLKQDITIFSSCPTVDVTVNGITNSTLTIKDGIATLKSISLKKGKNIIIARNGNITDKAIIEIVDNSYSEL